MGVFVRLRDLPALVLLLAIGLLIPAPRAGAASAIVLDKQLPELQTLARRAELRPFAPAQSATVEPICDVFANGYDLPGATACAGCFDKTINFAETDVDCGGTYCKPCADGQQCLTGGDCSSSLCNGATHLCAPVTCIDNMQNGTETDVDCGGGICPATCANGKQCSLNVDCTSAACNFVSGLCVASLCLDQRKDGAETDIDCGGGACPSCATGKACTVDTDCTTGVCNLGVCVASVCGTVEPDEVCDDGNTVTETSCPYGQASCIACNATCSATLNLTGHYCGDGSTDFANGEVCDDGNAADETSCPYGEANCMACNSTCSATLNLTGAYCGDGSTDFAYGEVCDDGNNVDETSCPIGEPTCTACNSTCTEVLFLTGSTVPTKRPAKGQSFTIFDVKSRIVLP
jgi:hypothetical protein